MNAGQVRAALRNRYKDCRRYAIAEEVGLTTGFSHRRLDMMVLDCYSSNGFRIDGIEIKVSTSDLRRELEDPEKHIAFFDVIDYYTIAAPAGVTDSLMEVIPKRWGIMLINEDGSTRYKRKPLPLEDRTSDRDVPRGFLASIVRSIQSLQPSAQELKKEYERGMEDGRKSERQKNAYMNERLKYEAEKLNAYDEISNRFRLWGEQDEINNILDEFERFRKLDTDMLKRMIERTVESLNSFAKKIGGGDEDADRKQ